MSGHHRARCSSFSGELNDEQPALLQRAMGRMPPGSMVNAAVDNDDAGNGYLRTLEGLFRALGRADLTFREDRPAFIGADWNDALKANSQGRPKDWPEP